MSRRAPTSRRAAYGAALAVIAAVLVVVACVRSSAPRRPETGRAPETPGEPAPTDAPTTVPPDAPPRETPGRVPIPELPGADEPLPPPRPAPPSPSPAPATATTPRVRVNLAAVNRAGTAALTVEGAWEIRSLDGLVIDRGRGLRGKLVVSSAEGRLGSVTLPRDGAELVPAADGDLRIDAKRYPGRLRIALALDGKRRAQIELDAETYLEGVVIGELPNDFPREAMRAQSIVARTYVLSQTGLGDVLVVEDTGMADQEFAGIAGTTAHGAAVREAVQSTRGLVVTAAGRPIRTWYHSTCGGRTCPAEVVFRTPAKILAAAREPGLRGDVACDACTTSSRYRWKDVRIPGAAVVKAAGLSGTLQGFSVAETTAGGRATSFDVRAGGRSARASAAEFRLAVGPKVLQSTWVDSAAVTGGDLVVSGRGWGHGVGMCQVGAKGYAGRGWTAERIVAFYYPGAELTRLW